ncbi:hypothetical protein [Photobacterium minamisatsumaniensis]|uniref:hypothetical protein n=1 Tax=Photobacterium minamisatsumaniensis TaxID=2910233 RepID=UPI003D09AA45
MNSKRAAQRWVMGGGVFNCVVAFPFSMPFLHESYINLFNWLNTALRFGGNDWIPPNDGGNMLFLNTAGLALFLVGMMLIYASKNVSSRIEIALFNGVVRLVWAMVAIYYLVNHEVINLLYLIVAIDLILASSYIYYYFTIKFIRNHEVIA